MADSEQLMKINNNIMYISSNIPGYLYLGYYCVRISAMTLTKKAAICDTIFIFKMLAISHYE